MKIITICGSMQFSEKMREEQLRLSREGNVILMPIINTEEIDTDEEMFCNIHFEKIRMSEEIFVINVGGYVGKHTAREIQFASQLGKRITFLETEPMKKHYEMMCDSNYRTMTSLIQSSRY